MRFGENLKRLRERAELSQSQLAEKAGLSVRNIQNWEQAHRVPRAPALLALAKSLGSTVEALLEGVDQEEPTQSPKDDVDRGGKRGK
jgi:transcriptional regulator with XRE-family HTH domain